MALPTILVNAATGSDSAASGAGPSTALTGTAASTSGDGLTVTLDGSPDLTNVATDGSHVIYLADATAGARNFGKITAKDNTAKTVTVANAFGLSVSGLSWAIGGKRAAIGSTSSRKLFENNSAAGDAMPGWIMQMESGHTETLTAAIVVRRSGDTTDGDITLQGDPAAGTMPVLTWTNNGDAISPTGAARWKWAYFDARNSNATRSATGLVGGTSSPLRHKFIGLKVAHATNYFRQITTNGGNQGWYFISCEFAYCSAAYAFENDFCTDAVWLNCYIHDMAGTGVIGTAAARVKILNNVFASCGIGINGFGAGSVVIGNTFYDMSGDALRVGSTGDMLVMNNIFVDGGAYGITTSMASQEAALALGQVFLNNCFYNNTSGATNPAGIDQNSITSDPGLTNPAGGDFSVGTAVKAKGYPIGGTLPIGSFSSTYSYVDIGAAQRQEPAGGGSSLGAQIFGG